jgi:hypothetical protein
MSTDIWQRDWATVIVDGWQGACSKSIGRTNVQLRAGNVVLPPVEGGTLCQPGNGVLRHCVGDVVGAWGVGGDGAVVDDSSEGQGVGRYMGTLEDESRERRKRGKGR